jgi:2-polyprenyl-3-methyl-5-hydroxy-6-metoxy-1,4-benzoquinol methylase
MSNESAPKNEYPYYGGDPPQDVRYLWPPVIEAIGAFPQSVCDLGCGNGAFGRRLAGLGHEVVGVDSSTSGIHNALAAVSGAKFLLRSIYDEIPGEMRGRFDVVVSMEVVEHLLLPRELIRRARELLRVGGRLILTTPYHGLAKNLLVVLSGRFDSHFSPLWDGGHVKFFSRSTLRKLVEEELVVERMWGTGRVPRLWKSLVLVGVKAERREIGSNEG